MTNDAKIKKCLLGKNQIQNTTRKVRLRDEAKDVAIKFLVKILERSKLVSPQTIDSTTGLLRVPKGDVPQKCQQNPKAEKDYIEEIHGCDFVSCSEPE